MDKVWLWTFPRMFEHLAHTAWTMHCASGSKLCHHTIVWYHTPFLTWHPLIAWLPILPSPLSGEFCHAASATSPPFFSSHWDSAWHADNARFLAPNIGESRIREPAPHSRPPHPYSDDRHGPTPTCTGNFFCCCFLCFRLLNLFR